MFDTSETRDDTAQVWNLAMRFPKSWVQPSKVTVTGKRKIEELLKLSSWFSPPQTQACIMATPLPPWEFLALHREFQPKHQSLKAFAVAFHRMCFLHGSSSLFEHLRVSVQFTLWCYQVSPKDSRAHFPSQLLVHPFTWGSSWQVRAQPCHETPMVQPQARSSNKAEGQVSGRMGQPVAKVTFPGIRKFNL